MNAARHTLGLMVLAIFVNAPADAASRAVILAMVDEAPARRGPIEVRLDQSVTLFAAVRQGGRWYTDAPAVRGVAAARVRPLAKLGDALTVRWRLVEPSPHHTTTASPNPDNPAYSNSVLFGARHGAWLGYDTLEYSDREIARGGVLALDGAHPTHPVLARQGGGLGTMRYSVELVAGDRTWRAPGATESGRGGISTAVFRVSYRRANDLVGWLESFYNVPNVFGSAGKGRAHQTDRHQGADCADVIVGAARKAGARLQYSSVAGLYRDTRSLTERLFLDETGLHQVAEDGTRVPVKLEWGKDVERGDLMLIKYGPTDWTGRRWDHIGVLAGDAGHSGVFDPADPLLHTGYLFGLVSEPASTHGPAIVQFSRFKARHLRAMKRRARAKSR